MSRSLVYAYFGDRGGLIAAVYLLNLEQLDQELGLALDDHLPDEVRLRRIIRRYLRFARDNEAAWSVLAAAGSLQHPAVQAARRERIERVAAAWGGGPRPDSSPGAWSGSSRPAPRTGSTTRTPGSSGRPTSSSPSCGRASPGSGREASSPSAEAVASRPMPDAPAFQIDPDAKFDVTFDTDKGEIVARLDAALAPNTVNNFVVQARAGFYDGLTFHRVVPGFVIQGGDPDGTGRGGPGYKFADEPVKGPYVLGAVAMANAGPDTNGSQFFICIDDCQDKLQPLYNLFGNVTSGIEVAQAIQVGDKMRKVTVTDAAERCRTTPGCVASAGCRGSTCSAPWRSPSSSSPTSGSWARAAGSTASSPRAASSASTSSSCSAGSSSPRSCSQEQHDTGRIRFGRFYLRRALRLLPALFFFFAVYLVYARYNDWPPFARPQDALDSVQATSLYYMNWRVLWTPLATADLAAMWSLSIEEQFYLVWPVLVAGYLGYRQRAGTVVTFLAMAFAAVTVWRIVVFHRYGWEAAYLRTDTRVDGLILGALVASLFVRGLTPAKLPAGRPTRSRSCGSASSSPPTPTAPAPTRGCSPCGSQVGPC